MAHPAVQKAPGNGGLRAIGSETTGAMSFRIAAGLIFVSPVASGPTVDSARAGSAGSPTGGS
jgi:hypothetical protein